MWAKEIIMLWISMMIANGLVMKENIIYKKVQDISPTRSVWKVALLLDLEPYEVMINRSLNDLNNLTVTTWSKIQQYESYVGPKMKHHLRNLDNELKFLQTSMDRVIDIFQNQQKLGKTTRNRRAVIPVVGTLWRYLFGYGNQDEISAIKRSIRTLGVNQGKLQHVVSESLSFINMTHHHVVENRERINRLNQGLNQLADTFRDTASRLTDKLEKVYNALSFYILLQSTLENAKEMMMELTFHMEHLQDQINLLSIGKISPITIKPTQLKDILTDIQGQLPNNLELPLDVQDNILDYYRLLSCTVALENNKIYITLTLPLIDRDNMLEIYQIHSLEIPNTDFNGSNGDILSRHPIATYVTEFGGIAINKQKTRYMTLSDNEIHNCAKKFSESCDLQSPLYPVNWSRLCVIALITGSESKIKKIL